MRKTLSALVLVLALCAPALAGDIPMPPAPQPPPPRGMTAEEPAQVNGDIQNDTLESLTDAVMAALEGVFSIF